MTLTPKNHRAKINNKGSPTTLNTNTVLYMHKQGRHLEPLGGCPDGCHKRAGMSQCITPYSCAN